MSQILQRENSIEGIGTHVSVILRSVCPVVSNSWKEDAGSLNATSVHESEAILLPVHANLPRGAVRESFLKEAALHWILRLLQLPDTCPLGAGDTKWTGICVQERSPCTVSEQGREEGRAHVLTGQVLNVSPLPSELFCAPRRKPRTPGEPGGNARLSCSAKQPSSYLSCLHPFLWQLVSPPLISLLSQGRQAEGVWPFKATFFPPRAVWLGWRR